MCEFTVILNGETVAKKVIKAKKKNGTLIMGDVEGTVTRLEGVSILSVDTIMAEMVLAKD